MTDIFSDKTNNLRIHFSFTSDALYILPHFRDQQALEMFTSVYRKWGQEGNSSDRFPTRKKPGSKQVTNHCKLIKAWSVGMILVSRLTLSFSFKEKVEFWEEVINNLWALSLYYASVEEHQIKNVPWKAWLFKCLNILSMACNIINIRTDLYATCSPIYIFLCTVLVILPRLGKTSYHFDDSRTLQYIQDTDFFFHIGYLTCYYLSKHIDEGNPKVNYPFLTNTEQDSLSTFLQENQNDN